MNSSKSKWVLFLIGVAAILFTGGYYATERGWGPFAELPVLPDYSGYKAFCVERIDTVNVVFWNEKPAKKDPEMDDDVMNMDWDSLNPELVKFSKEILDQFWKGDVSYVITSDRLNAIPHSERQLSLIFQERADGTLATFVHVYDGRDIYSKLVADDESDDPIEGFGYGFLQLKGDRRQDKTENLALYIRSLQDLASGRCDRRMSKFISGDQYKWNFMPPNEYKNFKKPSELR